jgi:uncharacterized protein DUF5666
VAAISGTSMEVQNPQTGQVTVSWTPTTTFSQTVTVSSSSVATGDCVTVTGSSSKGTITARSVSISQPSAGKCTQGPGGRFGAERPAGSGAGFTSPTGGFRPPSGSTGNGARRFPGLGNIAFASGQVAAVSLTSLTVSGFSSASLPKATTKPANNQKSAKTTKTARPVALKTTTVKIKLAASTTYTETQASAASTLAVGDCVTAFGSSSSTGAVTATTVRITSTGGQTCSPGFGRFRGGSTNGGSTIG